MAAGQRFQSQITGWWAARILLATPVGTTYGLASHCRADRIYCETTDAVDDIRVELLENAVLFCQCKRSLSISTKAESAMFANIGDVINMTQYPEAALAREKEMCYASICVTTDYDAGLGIKKTKVIKNNKNKRIFLNCFFWINI